MNYYNEFDPFASGWLRELIAEGLIPPGEVDERSIHDVAGADLKGFNQCHFFAGIGGWSLALKLANWPDDRPVWTGSPPCQPFSTAGKQKGHDDERHLWPEFFRLIKERRPPIIFGEQVAAAIRHGWFDNVQSDLEKEDYACGVVVLPACGFGAPHIRQRQWIVAERLGLPSSERSQGNEQQELCGERGRFEGGTTTESSEALDWMGQPHIPRPQQRYQASQASGHRNPIDSTGSDTGDPRNPTNGFWGDPDWLFCRDGKWRPAKSEIQPLGNGLPNRVGLLRGAGNAIVPQVAAEVITAYMEIRRSE